MKINRFGLALGVMALALGGCSGESVDPNLECNGKCESAGSLYKAVIDKVNNVDEWKDNEPGEVPMKTIEEAYQVEMQLDGGKTLLAKTHMFGTEKVTLIPYDNKDDTTDAAGNPVRGDQAVAAVFAPGEVGYAIKHHRTEHRVLNLTSGQTPDEDAMKENFKLNDTHIELVVGVERDGKPGAITLNNPQDYEKGRFGTIHYPMVFVKPIYPDEVERQGLVKAFNDNIRTMMMGFNAVSKFPGDYNGGDPLGAQSPDKVKGLVANMIMAIAGPADLAQEARAWFAQGNNRIYCAELAHVSSSAGMIVPLNEKNVMKLQELSLKGSDMSETQWEQIWANFQDLIVDHNDGKDTPFKTLNSNTRVHLVKLAPAADTAADQVAGNIPSTLLPAANYMTDESAQEALAFQPMTMADIIRHFLRTHVPRDPEMKGTLAATAKLNDTNEDEVTSKMIEKTMAPIQGALLQSLEMGIYNSMGLVPLNEKNGDELTADDQQKIGMRKTVVKPLFDAIVLVVNPLKESYANYAELQNALATVSMKDLAHQYADEDDGVDYNPDTSHPFYSVPVMVAAQKLTSPRGEEAGEGLFVPPSLLHTIAQGAHEGGLLGLRYVGHGLHFSLVEPNGNAVANTTDAPAEPEEEETEKN